MPLPSLSFNLKPFTVQTSVGPIPLWARDCFHAISTAQELVGRDKRVTRCEEDKAVKLAHQKATTLDTSVISLQKD